MARLVVRRPWAVIGFWIALAATLNLTVPPLMQVVREHSAEILPSDAPVMATARDMAKAFHEPGSQNVAVVVLTDEHGLSAADEDVYRRLVDRLQADHGDVVAVQNFVTTPALRDVTESKDHKAWFLPVSIAGQLGSPQANDAYAHVADAVKETVKGSALTANTTGLTATTADMSRIAERDLKVIEAATIVLVLLILLVVYRKFATMLLPLLTIGVSLVTAQQVVAGLAKIGLGLSDQTVVFMTAMMIGAGTDYAVFLISRYHEYLRRGCDSDEAVARALPSIGKVIAASAATVAVTFLGMVFTRLKVFNTVGPALAVSVAVAFLAAVTLLPAIMVLVGRRGWITPRRDVTTRFWRRSAVHIVRRPWAHLATSLVILGALASCATLVRYTYDARQALPSGAESNVGYQAMDRHFPVSSTVPQYIYVQSPHDLRNPRSLADLEQMAQRVSQLPDIATVRGVTRPTGQTLEEAKLSYQAGEVGKKLSDASGQIAGSNGDLDALTNGSRELADSLGQVAGQVNHAISAINGLAGDVTAMENRLAGSGTLQEFQQLAANMRAAGGSIGANVANVDSVMHSADSILAGLQASPVCSKDPACTNARQQLQLLVNAGHSGAFDGIANLAKQLQSTPEVQNMGASLQAMRATLDRAVQTIQSLGLANPAGLQQKLADMQRGANALADGSKRVADGVRALTDQTKQMGRGLSDAAAFLLSMKLNASQPGMSGFYLPPEAMNDARFADVAKVFVSPDGHAARYMVQSKLDPFSTEAFDQDKAILDTARGAQPNTSLADASISMSGMTPMYTEMRDYYNHDIRFIIGMTIAVVLLILTLLLRAVVAPLYLVGSVILSYLSALGIGVLVFQVIGKQPLGWSVPGMAFIVLVAVGADYNMLMISRIRDESPHGIRSGVIRTVRTTGGVITSAGLIFAASMFGMLFGSVSTMIQAGFIIGVGLLLDTFLVRTITVPALAVLVGNANWWPAKWRPAGSPGRAASSAKASHATDVQPAAPHGDDFDPDSALWLWSMAAHGR
ncbi:MMPL/RND family transporter [Mycobacterium sp. Marseille-P9652]|uniref:MMPL/RND family transporter n=1 Tax=Mycobacterium sp. Marseille-P9652 TaxID=2654950 RepID=UPI00351A370F